MSLSKINRRIFLLGATSGISSKDHPVGGGVHVLEQLLEELPPYFSGSLIQLYGGSTSSTQVYSWGSAISLELPILQGRSLSALLHLSEWHYSHFARQFEKAATAYLLETGATGDLVIVNDISEGPHFQKLAQAGFILIPLFHIGVAEFFCKLYLRNYWRASTLCHVFLKIEKSLGRWVIPPLLQLIFTKERHAVHYGKLLIVPSEGLKQALIQCYGEEYSDKIKVIPWNFTLKPLASDPLLLEKEIQAIRQEYQLDPKRPVWMTLSRISWEKGLEILISALQRLPKPHHFYVFICGEAAYMGGKRYLEKLKKQAQYLPVFFPGYVQGLRKEAFFHLAQRFLSTSHYEAFGLTLQEALHYQVPVLSLDHHGARQHKDLLSLVQGDSRRQRIESLTQALQKKPLPPKPLPPVPMPSVGAELQQYVQQILSKDQK